MSDEKRREWERKEAMLDAPASWRQLPNGLFRVEKSGIVGVGPTLDEATEDFAEKFAVAFTRPSEGH